MNQIEDWIGAFNEHLKTKTFEHFSILLYDHNKSSIEQKKLLYKILFEDHKSIINWSKYIDFTIQTFPDRKLQLQRLINKSLEFINIETEIKCDKELYQKILSQLSDLKSSETSSQRLLVNSKSSTESINNIPLVLESQGFKLGDSHSNPSTYTIMQSSGSSSISIDKKSNNLSKYIDATLLNFNPKTLRKNSCHQNTSSTNKILKSTIVPQSTVILENSNSNNNNNEDLLKKDHLIYTNINTTKVSEETNENNNALPSNKVRINEHIKEENVINKTPGRKQLFSIDDVSPSFVNSIPPLSSTKAVVTAALYLPSNQKQCKSNDIPTVEAEDNVSEILDVLNGSMSTTIKMTLIQSNSLNEDKNTIEKEKQSENNIRLLSTSLTSVIHDNKHNSKKVSFQPTISSSSMDSNIASSSIDIIYSSEHITSPKINNMAKDKVNTTREIALNQTASKNSNNSSSSHSNINTQSNQEQLSHKKGIPDKKGLFQNNILDESSRRIELNGKSYTRLNVLGKGGSSCVYRIIGNEDGQIYAYKRVEVREADDMNAVFDNYANEIALLKKLRVSDETSNEFPSSSSTSSYNNNNSEGRSRIIELIDYEVCKAQRYVAMLLEPGDIDLAKVLSQKNSSGQYQNNHMLLNNNQNCNKSSSSSSSSLGSLNSSSSSSNSGVGGGTNIIRNNQTNVSTNSHAYITSLVDTTQVQHQYLDPFFARMVWREMLEAVDHIHKHRIVHGDLKPANFVFVKGHLKLIDFGIAKSFSSDTTNIYRESQIGTINYMAPEAIAPMSVEECEIIHNQTDNDRIKMRLGRASDIWSLGCILYQMIYGRPPFAALNTIQKLTTIPNPKHVIKYNDCGDQDAIDSIKACLVHDPRGRSPISGVDGLLCKPYLQINRTMCISNTHQTMLPTKIETACQTECAEPVPISLSIDENKLQCIVSAVLDSLNNIAEQSLIKLKSSNRTGVSTRRGTNLNNPNQVMERVTKDVIKWLDEVNQTDIECEVVDLIQQQDWWKKEESELNNNSSSTSNQIQNDVILYQKQQISLNVDKEIQSPGINHNEISNKSTSKRKLEVLNDILNNKKPFATNTVSEHSSNYIPSNKQDKENITNSHHSVLYTSNTNNTNITSHSSIHNDSLNLVLSSHTNKSRTPLKSIPISLKDQIQNNNIRILNNSKNSNDRASKWMKPIAVVDIEKQDMRSILEKRIGDMRKFLDVDQDNITVTDTVDITGFTDFF